MEIVFTKNFKKQYNKLSLKRKEKTDKIILCFMENPFNKKLNNHKLQGRLLGMRAISITGDLRVIFIEEGDFTLITFLDLGNHNNLYN